MDDTLVNSSLAEAGFLCWTQQLGKPVAPPMAKSVWAYIDRRKYGDQTE